MPDKPVISTFTFIRRVDVSLMPEKKREMRFTLIIPARYQSTRFPGKPLALIHGKPMIIHVMERTREVLDEVWVATDHEGIAQTVRDYGGQVVMTSPDHASGTDRCAEAARIIAQTSPIDVVINVQGDEPFIRPEQIRELMGCFTPGVEIATLVRRITDPADLENPNKPKVVLGRGGEALYFSRSAIPYLRGRERSEWVTTHDYWAHIGLYGYRLDVLNAITRLPAGTLETAESLEQLRWLENGYRIQTAVTEWVSIGIDTPADLEEALKRL
jgi:3-deoxy-manno-octulosonate cytidylyltransferase (CMP-KDO synthetase)